MNPNRLTHYAALAGAAELARRAREARPTLQHRPTARRVRLKPKSAAAPDAD